MELLIISGKIKKIYPEALLGILAIRKVCNPTQHEELDRCKLELENNLREKYAGVDKAYLKNTEPIKNFSDYYKRFKNIPRIITIGVNCL